jgi:hypothetical protein
MVAVPVATATTLNVALDEPAGIMRGVCTVATAGALLVSEMLAPLVGAASVRLTVPCPLAPTATLVMLRATADTLTVVGAVGEEPHRATRLAASSSVANLAARGVTFMRQRYGRCGASRCAVEHSVDRAIVVCPGPLGGYQAPHPRTTSTVWWAPSSVRGMPTPPVWTVVPSIETLRTPRLTPFGFNTAIS